MKISILLATRKRSQSVVRAIKSLIDNISHDNDIEILLRFDDDDLDTVISVKESIHKEMGDIYKKIKCFIGPRYGWPGLYRYYNELAYSAEGDWVMVFADDLVMTTKNWDKEIEKYDGQTVIWGSWIPTFPRKIFKIWGYMFLTRNGDTEINEITKILGQIGYNVSINPEIHILRDEPNDVITASRDYQADYNNLKYVLSRMRCVKLLKEYIDTGEIIRNDIDFEISSDDLFRGTGIPHSTNISTDVNVLIKDFEKKKSDMNLYHHIDQVNLQKNEYELLAKIRPEVTEYSLFKLLCHIVPFKNAVPHIFNVMKLARYSKVGILEIRTGQGENSIALGIGARVYGLHNPKLTTIDTIQQEGQVKGYFELFKEFLPSDRHIIQSDPKSFSFNEPIDLLLINADMAGEDVYTICKKYIPLVIKDGIVIFINTIYDVTCAILKYLDENKSNIKYKLLSPDITDSDSRFLYNVSSIATIKIIYNEGICR